MTVVAAFFVFMKKKPQALRLAVISLKIIKMRRITFNNVAKIENFVKNVK